jgi:hypothetical protein
MRLAFALSIKNVRHVEAWPDSRTATHAKRRTERIVRVLRRAGKEPDARTVLFAATISSLAVSSMTRKHAVHVPSGGFDQLLRQLVQ